MDDGIGALHASAVHSRHMTVLRQCQPIFNSGTVFLTEHLHKLCAKRRARQALTLSLIHISHKAFRLRKRRLKIRAAAQEGFRRVQLLFKRRLPGKKYIRLKADVYKRQELDDLLSQLGGKPGAVQTLEKLEQAEKTAEDKLAALLEQLRGTPQDDPALSAAVVKAANDAESKRRQADAVNKLVDASLAQNQAEAGALIARAVDVYKRQP